MAGRPSQPPSVAALYLRRVGDGLMGFLFVGACFAIYFCFGTEHFYEENALFELGQNLFLFAGVAVFYAATSISEDRTCQTIMWGLTLFCASMLLREVDVRGTDLEPYFSSMFQNRLHYIVLAVFWVGLFLMVITNMAATMRNTMQWLVSGSGAWLVAGVIFYIIGDMAEKNLFTTNDDLAKMVEESAELLGTLFIFYAGYVSLRRQVGRQAGLTTSQRMLSPDSGQ